MAVEGINRELFTKWVDALEEDDRVQGHGALERVWQGRKEQCCKGVLCEVAGPELAGTRVVSESGDYVTYSGRGGLPPHRVMLALFNGDEDLLRRHTRADGDPDMGDLILFDVGNPRHPLRDGVGGDEPFTAVVANDAVGWSFRQIAQAIRRRYLDD